MSTYRMTVTVEVYDEALAEHDHAKRPPPADVADWYGGDLIEAVREGIAEILEHGPIEDIERIEVDG